MSPLKRIDPHRIAAEFEKIRPAITGYLARLLMRGEAAEEAAREAAGMVVDAGGRTPADERDLRPWFYAVATRLALDALRQSVLWRETALQEARARAAADGGFIAETQALRGTPEAGAIGREHLAFCFSSLLRCLPPRHAAAILLKEVHGLTTGEAAAAIGCRFEQARGWIEEAREALGRTYESSCGLLGGKGGCRQCLDLDDELNGVRRDPLAGTDGSLEARLDILRSLVTRTPGRWHRRLAAILEALP